MRIGNKLYQNQGIHVISAIFTVIDNQVKVLLIKRKNKPYENMWGLVGGALYNNETLEDGTIREIFEKTGLSKVNLFQFGTYDEIDKTPDMRMIAVCYLGVIDASKATLIKENKNTSDASWFNINSVPELAFNHNKILNDGIVKLKEKITESNILKTLFPNEFTMPEIQRTYETILQKQFDRRNFRKKIISLGLVEDVNKTISQNGSKPAKLYRFKVNVAAKKIF